MADRETEVRLALPEWVKGRMIRVFAGIEEVAHRRPGERWKIKKGRCSQCGKCCMNVPEGWPQGRGPNGHCQHLKPYPPDRYICGLGVNRPFSCCWGNVEGEDCTVSWK